MFIIQFCPKYKGKLGFGEPFVLFSEPKDRIYLTEEYAESIKSMKEAMLKKISK